MKVKFKDIAHDRVFVHNKSEVKAGDEIDVTEARATELVNRGVVDIVKEKPKQKKNSTESKQSEK